LFFILYYLTYDLVYYWMHRFNTLYRGGGQCIASTIASVK